MAGHDTRPQRLPGSRRRASRAERGTALLEVLVSVLLFSFGLLGLIALEAKAINFSVDSEDRNRAAVFANEIASTMWLTGSITPTAAQREVDQQRLAERTQTDDVTLFHQVLGDRDLVAGKANADVPGVGSLGIDGPKIEIAGTAPLSIASWRQAYGSIGIDAHGDLTKAADLLRPVSEDLFT